MNALEAQLRQCFCRVVYAHKTHLKEADACGARLDNTKLAQIVLSALTTGGLVTALFAGDDLKQTATLVAAVLSTLLLVVNAYVKNVDPGRQAELHAKAATQLWDTREGYLSLLADLADGRIDDKAAVERRDRLQATLAKIYEGAPRNRPASFAAAKAALDNGNEATYTESQIDPFLPETLRRAA